MWCEIIWDDFCAPSHSETFCSNWFCLQKPPSLFLPHSLSASSLCITCSCFLPLHCIPRWANELLSLEHMQHLHMDWRDFKRWWITEREIEHKQTLMGSIACLISGLLISLFLFFFSEAQAFISSWTISLIMQHPGIPENSRQCLQTSISQSVSQRAGVEQMFPDGALGQLGPLLIATAVKKKKKKKYCTRRALIITPDCPARCTVNTHSPAASVKTQF